MAVNFYRPVVGLENGHSVSLEKRVEKKKILVLVWVGKECVMRFLVTSDKHGSCRERHREGDERERERRKLNSHRTNTPSLHLYKSIQESMRAARFRGNFKQV